MPIVGALAQVERNDHEQVRRALSQLEGVETFDLDDPGLVGLMIEADDEESARRVLARAVSAVRGVLHAWPVSLDLDDDAVTRKTASVPAC